jgi:hypothetical protein
MAPCIDKSNVIYGARLPLALFGSAVMSDVSPK